ncbi:MAG TPA: single-stranded-DNA-specific exonuclease RecJ [Candidatus Paceibacterota bacterium]
MRYALRPVPLPKPAEFSAYSDALSTLLLNRGIATPAAAQAFLSPDYGLHVHDPYLMRDMDKAVARVYRAVKKGEKVIVFSDYDADGMPAGVVVHDLFRKIGFNNFENYIPHRHNEGFGLSMKAVESFAEKGAGLLITIDCGISNVTEVTRANSLGIDVIIMDHHLPHAELPAACAILNPKVSDCAYPEKMLCGAGVAYKFAQAFVKAHGAEFNVPTGWEKWLLDMVGIATLSDMVPLVGENRALAHYGLAVLRKTRRPGLSRLFTKLRVSREHLSEDDIGFTITPRLNAASRMGEPEHAFRLLSTDDEALAGAYADALEHVNNERKGTVAGLVKEIKKMLSERDITSKSVIVIGNPLWRPSLLGLVANTLSDEYGKPAFLWGRDGQGVIKGSCRNAGDLSVVAIMEGAKESFSEYGGHTASGGFAVLPDAIHSLEEKLCAACDVLSTGPASTVQEELLDAEISLGDVGWELYKDVERLAPYGTGNPKPLFLVRKAYIDSVKSFGKEKNHTEIIVRDDNFRKLSAIMFFTPTTDLPKHVSPGRTADFVVHLEKSTFKNYPELRLRVVAIP